MYTIGCVCNLYIMLYYRYIFKRGKVFSFFSYILIIYIKCIFYVYFKIIAVIKLLIAWGIISQRHEDYLDEHFLSRFSCTPRVPTL